MKANVLPWLEVEVEFEAQLSLTQLDFFLAWLILVLGHGICRNPDTELLVKKQKQIVDQNIYILIEKKTIFC